MPGYELIGEEERSFVNGVFDSGGILVRQGLDAKRGKCYKVREFETKFASCMESPHALAVTSGTAALRVALATLDLEPDDEVITQSFTFVATVEAIIEARAKPICTEIDSTLNMDPEDLKLKITKKTKAVIVVHMLGVPARLREIKKICDEHGVILIEDTAWGCGGSLDGKKLGTWGSMGTFSFDYAKAITTGEGGMILFQDKPLFEKAAAWHDHGHENNPNLPRWEDSRSSSGFNFRMMELQGALGLAQLAKLGKIIDCQRKTYMKLWEEIESIPGVTSREIPEGSYYTADSLVFFAETKDLAIKCRNELLQSSISTKILPEAVTWHFAKTWFHMKELVANNDLAFPKSTFYLDRAVSLPIFIKIDDCFFERAKKAIYKALN